MMAPGAGGKMMKSEAGGWHTDESG